MTIQLYIKPNVIGLCFETQSDRDQLWLKIGAQDCAELFGERSIRFNPAKATAKFHIGMEAEVLDVFMDKPVNSVPTPPTETRVVPTAPAPIEPVAIISPDMTFDEPTTKKLVSVENLQQPAPATIEMPQVASVNAPQQPPKPPDLRSRAGREWKQKNKGVNQSAI